MVIFLFTLSFCFPSTDSQDCVSINQTDDAYLHQPTTLNCKVEISGAMDDDEDIKWYLVDRSSMTPKYYISIAFRIPTKTVVDINPDYAWKYTSEWDGVSKIFSLTIRNTTLMDDGAHTLWLCGVMASFLDAADARCLALYALDVKVGRCNHRQYFWEGGVA